VRTGGQSVDRKKSHRRANPTTQTIEEPAPCKIRAIHITEYFGASINMICEPTIATRPMISGILRVLYRSENMAAGMVAGYRNQKKLAVDFYLVLNTNMLRDQRTEDNGRFNRTITKQSEKYSRSQKATNPLMLILLCTQGPEVEKASPG